MIPYIFLFVSSTLLAVVLPFFKKLKTQTIKAIVVFYFFGVLYLLASFKSVNVGNDTLPYMETYQSLGESKFLDFSSSGFEIGFSFLMQFFSIVKAPFFVFLLFINFPIYFSFAYLFYKKSPYPLFSCFLYAFFSLMVFSISAIRQSLSMSLFIIVYLLLTKKRTIATYIIAVLLTAFSLSIHISSIVMAVIFVLPLLGKITKNNFLLLTILLFVVFFFSEYIYGFIFYYLIGQRTYAPGSYGGGGLFILSTLFFVFVCLFGYTSVIPDAINNFFEKISGKILCINKFKLTKGFLTDDFNSILILFLAFLIFQAFCRTNVNFPRFGFYFLPFAFVAIPQIISIQKSQLFRVTLVFGITLFFLIYFIKFVVFGDNLNTIPFEFMWS